MKKYKSFKGERKKAKVLEQFVHAPFVCIIFLKSSLIIKIYFVTLLPK